MQSLLFDQGPTRWALKERLARYGEVYEADPSALIESELDRLAGLRTADDELLCVHPGTGSLDPFPGLWTAARDRGLVPLLPNPRNRTWSQDQLQFLRDAETQGVRTLLLHDEPFSSIRELEAFIQRAGLKFPLVLKSVLGSGGWGVWVVRSWDDLAHGAARWFDQLRLRLGQPLVFVERYASDSRHWELGFCRRADGSLELPALTESSLQSRYRKVVSFTFADPKNASRFLDATTYTQMVEAAQRVLDAASFVGVGTLEFLVDGVRPHLVEMLPRLPTHWPAWEIASGVDPVALQLEVFTGEAFAEVSPHTAACVATVRILAEDPVLELPRPGEIFELQLPESTVSRQWVGIPAPCQVRPTSQSCLGLVMGSGTDSSQALEQVRQALRELWIAGTLCTNERHVAELLDHPWTKEGHFYAGFVDEEFIPRFSPPEDIQRSVLALCSADITELRSLGSASRRFLGFPISGDPTRWRFRAGDWWVDYRARATRQERVEVRALCGGKIRALFFREGAPIPAHESALWIECFGVLVPHALPRDVWLERWNVAADTQVREGDVLGWVRTVPPI